MKPPPAPTDDQLAPYIAFEEFRNGMTHGRFRVIVNPDLARLFVAQRLHATPVAIALIGPGIASALAGYPLLGGLLVAGGLLLRRMLRAQAPKILLQLATRQRAAYEDATAQGVMEASTRPVLVVRPPEP